MKPRQEDSPSMPIFLPWVEAQLVDPVLPMITKPVLAAPYQQALVVFTASFTSSTEHPYDEGSITILTLWMGKLRLGKVTQDHLDRTVPQTWAIWLQSHRTDHGFVFLPWKEHKGPRCLWKGIGATSTSGDMGTDGMGNFWLGWGPELLGEKRTSYTPRCRPCLVCYLGRCPMSGCSRSCWTGISHAEAVSRVLLQCELWERGQSEQLDLGLGYPPPSKKGSWPNTPTPSLR